MVDFFLVAPFLTGEIFVRPFLAGAWRMDYTDHVFFEPQELDA
jgi:hypothetical protein